MQWQLKWFSHFSNFIGIKLLSTDARNRSFSSVVHYTNLRIMWRWGKDWEMTINGEKQNQRYLRYYVSWTNRSRSSSFILVESATKQISMFTCIVCCQRESKKEQEMPKLLLSVDLSAINGRQWNSRIWSFLLKNQRVFQVASFIYHLHGFDSDDLFLSLSIFLCEI